MRITVEPERFGCYLITAEDGQDILIQTDWDFPGTARTFGWAPKPGPDGCQHRGTDGTITCPDCGRTAGSFIAEARDYLDAGPDDVEDPGYFE